MSVVNIDSFEKRLGTALPEDYTDFLTKGTVPTRRVFVVPGQGRSRVRSFIGFGDGFEAPARYLSLYGRRLPSEVTPIGEDAFGNLVCLAIRGPHRGSVYFWDHENESEPGTAVTYDNMTLLAPSFVEFVRGLESA